MKFNETINVSILLIVIVFATLICIDCLDKPTETIVEPPELQFGNYYMLISRSLDPTTIDQPDTLFKARQVSETTFIDIKGEVEYQILPFVCGEGECEE